MGALRAHPGVALDHQGYAADFHDLLLPDVCTADFEADLAAGDGNELQTKFRAAHSSSALAVNCFAPFRRRLADLWLPGCGLFDTLRFEARCPTGLRGGRSPNLDLLLEGPGGVVGIESKLTEYLSRHRAAFSPAYAAQAPASWKGSPWFDEMLRLIQAPDSYRWLDAAQLIKHAFGLAHSHAGRPAMLLYLFWEPQNPAAPEFAEHRAEIAAFAQRVNGAGPQFAALSYPELWAHWQASPPASWLSDHLQALQRRYAVPLSSS